MTNRDNHYEAAFEEYLRSKQVPYVAVDEARRSLLGDGQSIKNLDFIVSAPGSVAWLVDVKGRRFPSAEDQYWKNWSTRDDLTSLAQWESLFGPTFRGLFVFAYHIVGDRAPLSVQQLFEHKGSTLRLRRHRARRLCRAGPHHLARLGHRGHVPVRLPPPGPAGRGVPLRPGIPIRRG